MKRPFKTWLVNEHADEDTPVGDLARDVRADPGFPSEGDLRRYLTDVWGADTAVLDCFEEAWRLYEPFATWLRETYGREDNTQMSHFVRQFAPLLPTTGDRAALRAALQYELGGVLTPYARRTLNCFDVSWQMFRPTCIRDGCEQTVDHQVSLCTEHCAEDLL